MVPPSQLPCNVVLLCILMTSWLIRLRFSLDFSSSNNWNLELLDICDTCSNYLAITLLRQIPESKKFDHVFHFFFFAASESICKSPVAYAKNDLTLFCQWKDKQDIQS